MEWRLKAFRHWQTMEEPHWPNVKYPPIDYQAIVYYSAPKQKAQLKSLDEVDPELLSTYAKLGIPLREQEWLAGVAVTPCLIVSPLQQHPKQSSRNWVLFFVLSQKL